MDISKKIKNGVEKLSHSHLISHTCRGNCSTEKNDLSVFFLFNNFIMKKATL